MIQVNHPKAGLVQFKDGTSEEEMAKAMRSLDTSSGSSFRMSAPSAPRDETAYTVTGMSPRESRLRGEAAAPALSAGAKEFMSDMGTAVRYGGPIAAGAITAPFTAGMSVPASMALMSGTGAVSSGVSEYLAQKMQGADETDWGHVRSMTALGATPYLPKGSTGARASVNLPSALLTTEAARLAGAESWDEYKQGWSDENKWLRLGPSAVMSLSPSLIGGMTQRITDANARRMTISKERFGGGVLLKEVFPSGEEGKKWVFNPEAAEEQAYIRGNKNAQKAYDSMGMNVGDALAQNFPPQELASVTEKLRPMITQLDDAQKAAALANEKFMSLTAKAEQARLTNSIELPKLEAEAAKAGMEKVQADALKNASSRMFFGGLDPLEEASAGLGAHQVSLTNAIDASKKHFRASSDEMYRRAGIDVNDTIVTWDDVLENVKKNRGKDKDGKPLPLYDNEVYNEFIATLSPIFEKANGSLSMSKFRNVKQEIADGFAAAGKDRSAAERKAAGMYNVLAGASEDFLARTRPQSLEPWKQANKAYADFMGVSGSDTMGMLAEGNVEGFVGKLQKEGWNGKLRNEFNDYRRILANAYSPDNPNGAALAENAAKAFEDDFFKVVRGGLVNQAVDKGSGIGGIRTVDINKMASAVESLRAQRFPVDKLQMGKHGDINKLAQIASAGGRSGLNMDEINQFFTLVDDLGATKAGARVEYDYAVRKWLIAHDVPGKRRAEQEMLRAADKAGVDAKIAQQTLTRAQQDPVVMFLANDRMEIPKDPSKSGEWIDRLLTLDADALRNFQGALVASGRQEDASKIARAALARVMRNFEKASNNEEVTASLNKIYDFFKAPGDQGIKSREAFRAVIGDEQWNSLNQKFIDPISRIVGAKRSFANIDQSSFGQNARLRAAPSTLGVTTFIGLKPIIDLARDGRYNMLYNLYLNPKTAPAAARAAKNTEAAFANDMVFRNVIRLSNMDDGVERDRLP